MHGVTHIKIENFGVRVRKVNVYGNGKFDREFHTHVSRAIFTETQMPTNTSQNLQGYFFSVMHMVVSHYQH